MTCRIYFQGWVRSTSSMRWGSSYPSSSNNHLPKPTPRFWKAGKFDDDSRSSWDILWTCLSTHFACTWTALHLAVPGRDRTTIHNSCIKFLLFIGALLAPEFMAGLAADELSGARLVAENCNLAFDHTGNSEPRATHWGVIHGFCVKMNGVVLQSKDGWSFQVDQFNLNSPHQGGSDKNIPLEGSRYRRPSQGRPVCERFYFAPKLLGNLQHHCKSWISFTDFTT